MRNNGVDVLELWPPIERGIDAVGVGHNGRRIAGPPAAGPENRARWRAALSRSPQAPKSRGRSRN